jgi:hypothetical protein
MFKNQNEFHCSDCGTEVSEGARFCQNCGAKLEWEEPAPGVAEKSDGMCSECGSPVSIYHALCPVCGTRLRNQKPDPPPLPMNLGDIISSTVQLIGKVVLRYLSIVLVIFIPASVIITFAMRDYYSFLGDAVGKANLAGAGVHFGILLIGIGTIIVAVISGTVAVTTIVRGEIYGLRCRWQEAIGSAFGVYGRRAVGQLAVIGISFICAVIFCVFVFVIVKGYVLVTVFAALAVIAAVVGAMYVYMRFAFSVTAIVCEEASVIRSMRRSWDLVRGTWWRVCGIMFLMAMLSGFAVTIVTTPLTFLGFWDFYKESFKAMAAGHGGLDPAAMPGALKSMGLGLGISTSVNIALMGLITPIYTTLLYYDLRARNGEFQAPEPGPISGAGAPVEPVQPSPGLSE